MSGLIGAAGFSSSFAFNLLWYFALVEMGEENPTCRSMQLEKGGVF